jgi:hypothetical protein
MMSAQSNEPIYNASSGTSAFDTLRYAKQMQKAGFTMEQAELQAETFLAIVQEQLVSKNDLKTLESTLTYKLEKLAAQSNAHANELEAKTALQMKEIDARTNAHIELVHREIKEIEAKTTTQIKELEAKTTTQIKELEAKTTTQIKELEAKTTNQIELVHRDIKELEAKTTTQIKELETKTTIQIELVRREIKELDLKITTQITTTTNALGKDLKIWMGTSLIGSVLALSALFAFFNHLTIHAIK